MNEDYLKENGVDVDKALELFGDIDTYNNTLKEFIKEVPETLDKLRKSKEISDMQNYAIYAHSIKSDARYFGFNTLADMALLNENAGKENNMYYVSENFNAFEDEIIRCLSIASKYLGVDSSVSKEEFDVGKTNDVILVVDDSNVIKKFIDNIFNKKYNVVMASNGEECINIINNHDYNIRMMLLDLNMPGVNGLEVLEYFKNNNLFDKIPVTVITGVGSDDVLNKAKEYPIRNFILKPFNEKVIKEIVEGV